MSKKIAILASGSGTNAENLIRYFENHLSVEVVLILSNKKDAYVLERAQRLNIPSHVFTREEFDSGVSVVALLRKYRVDLVVLSGFLLRISDLLLLAYPQRIVNIHPALLPKYGGKGMYGNRVHEAVVAAHDSESGITIHYINEHYDEGNIIFQAQCEVLPTDSPEDVAQKVHELEYEWFPQIVEEICSRLSL